MISERCKIELNNPKLASNPELKINADSELNFLANLFSTSKTKDDVPEINRDPELPPIFE